MILKFNTFISESENNIELSYYSFDWDDNILHMPTVIHMDKKVGDSWEPIDVSTSTFAVVRNDSENYRIRNNDLTLAFSEFRDFGPRGDMAFLEDTIDAINLKKFGPSWDSFIRCLSESSLFSIITARGHEPESIRKSVEYIIDNVLTENEQFLMYSNCLKHSYIFSPYDTDNIDRIPKGKLSETKLISDYLDICDFYGVSSNSFAKEFGESNASNPEVAKQMALDKFVEKCNKYGGKIGVKSVSVGFSDDDPKNVEHIHKFFKEKSGLMHNSDDNHEVKLSVFKTTNPNLRGGEKTKFRKGEIHESNYAPGLESSVVPFSKWTSDTQWRNPNTRDLPMDNTHNMVKNQTKLAVDLYKEFAYKKKRKRRI